MRQEEWILNTKDDHKVYGVTDYAKEAGSADKCLVLVHGLSGSANEYHIRSAANYFVAKGYDVIRFNLYASEKGARRLRGCNLQIHASDLNLVIDEKTKSYKKIFLSGHSYGGPTIMIAQPKQANALSLWDPTFNLPRVFSPERDDFIREKDYVIWSGGVEKLLGNEFVEEATTRYDTHECLALSKNLSHVPIQVLTAEDCIYVNEEKSWNSAGHPANERHIIKGADHCFFRGNALEEVLSLSCQWFERF